MNIEKEQINLIMKRRGERWDNKPLRPTRDNLNYLGRFFKRQKRLSIIALVFLFLQGILEIGLIAVSHQYLKNNGLLYLSIKNLNLFLIILILSSGYLISYFISIKSERTLVIRLINDLRLKWFKLSLHQEPNDTDLDNKGIFLAKISYHLPLLSTGLTNSLIGAIHWILLIIILIFLSIIFGFKFLLLLVASVLISLLIALGAYYISKRYVTRETTFYSKIIKLSDFVLSDWNFTKFFRREKTAAQEFTQLVNLDSYFRVRRDLWLRFSGGVVFVLLIFLSWTLGLFGKEVNSFLTTAGTDVKFTLIIFIIYFSRLLYESLRVGLYLVPFFLGLSLSVPLRNPKKLNRDIDPNFKEIEYKSAKTKFYKKGSYHKDLNFKFTTGGRYLICGPHREGKTSLAQLMTGNGSYGRRAWIIKARNKRFFYNDFFENYSGFYFLDPRFTSQRTLLEIALGKEKSYVTNEDFERLTERVNAHPELNDIFFERDDWRLKSFKLLHNAKSILLIQVLYCLEKKPFLITLDNYWLDYGDPEINALLSLLSKELPKSIIVFFASKNRNENYDKIANVCTYNKSYEI